MSHPSDRSYAKTHEWAKISGPLAVVGISHHAQNALGDITFIELPGVGTNAVQGKEFGVVESVKAASDLYSPLSGEIVEVNSALAMRPELLNKDPHESGWIMKLRISNPAESKTLMDGPGYEQFLKSEA